MISSVELRSQKYCNKLVCTSKHLFSEGRGQIISYCTTPNINPSEFKPCMCNLMKILTLILFHIKDELKLVMIDLLPSMNYAYNYICCQLTKGQFTE